MRSPYDQGLQTERTLLAWRRTCLALALGSAVLTRLMVEMIGLVAIFIGLGGIVSAALAFGLAGVRYRRVHLSLHRVNATGGDGRPLAFLSAGIVAVSLGCLFFVLSPS